MSTSARALAASSQIPEADRPISEQYRLIGLQWVDAEAAAKLHEELKTHTLSKMKRDLITKSGESDMADNKAERIVRSSPEWETYIREMCRLRAIADKLKVQKDSLRMRHSEWIGYNADARQEMKMG